MAFFVYVVDIKGYKKWVFPFVVFGANSIVVYIMHESLQRHLRERFAVLFNLEDILGDAGLLVAHIGSIAVVYYIAYWMYKNRVFIKV